MLPLSILLSWVLQLTHPVLLSLGWCHVVVSDLLWLCRIYHKNLLDSRHGKMIVRDDARLYRS